MSHATHMRKVSARPGNGTSPMKSSIFGYRIFHVGWYLEGHERNVIQCDQWIFRVNETTKAIERSKPSDLVVSDLITSIINQHDLFLFTWFRFLGKSCSGVDGRVMWASTKNMLWHVWLTECLKRNRRGFQWTNRNSFVSTFCGFQCSFVQILKHHSLCLKFAIYLEEILEKHNQGIYELKIPNENQPLTSHQDMHFSTIPPLPLWATKMDERLLTNCL